MSWPPGTGLTLRVTDPPSQPLRELDSYTQNVIRARRRGAPDLARAVEQRLQTLAMARARLEVTVGDEIRQLHELGLDAPAALAAASWAARDWLEEPGFIEGAPADLVLYRTDPRRDLGAVFKPELILAGGARVVASFAHVRPRHSLWTERIERD